MSDVQRLDLYQLEALADEATQWPWMLELRDRVASEHVVKDGGFSWHPFVCNTDSGMEDDPDDEQDRANAAFIAAARTAIPALIAELRSAREQLDSGHTWYSVVGRPWLTTDKVEATGRAADAGYVLLQQFRGPWVPVEDGTHG